MKNYAVIFACLAVLGGPLMGQPVDEDNAPASTAPGTSTGEAASSNPSDPSAQVPTRTQNKAAIQDSAPPATSVDQNITEPSGAPPASPPEAASTPPTTGTGTDASTSSRTTTPGSATTTTTPPGTPATEDIFVPTPAGPSSIIVTVEGIVKSEAERTQIEQRLQVVPGIRAVISRLQVAGQNRQGAQGPQSTPGIAPPLQQPFQQPR